MIWFGRCSVTMDSPSVNDPMRDFAPGRMLPSLYGVFDWTLPQGRIVHEYLTEGTVERDGEARGVAAAGAAAGGAS